MKRSKRKKGNDRIAQIGLVLVIILFIFIVYKIFNLTVQKNEHIDLSNNEYYQYFYGIKEEMSGKIEVIQKDDEVKLLLENGKNIYLDSTPIYYKEILGKVLFAKEMELVMPDIGIHKLEKFTNIIESNQAIYVKRQNNNNMKKISNAFLFDGNDLYFFLENTTIEVAGNNYEVSPFSYAIVNYRDSVEIYNYDKDEYIILQSEEIGTTDVLAKNRIRNYTINMSVDSVSTEKSDYLLIQNVNNLNLYNY